MIARELARLQPHDRAAARRRFGYLQRFWTADIEAGGRNRCQVRCRVVEEIRREHPGVRISAKALEYWGLLFDRYGIAGLAGKRGRRGLAAGRVHGAELAEELDQAVASLQRIADRLRRDAQSVR